MRDFPVFGAAAGGEIAGPGALVVHVDLDHGGAGLMPELAELVTAWPLGASLAAAVAVRGVRTGRRRTALNEALHELRRPLQALALAPAAAGGAEPVAIQGSVRMAAVALERLEREINGEAPLPMRETVQARSLLASAVDRWRALATLAGGSLSLRWHGEEATLEADRCAIAQALDNLVVNAIEHGGPEIVVEASAGAGSLRVAVVDRGRGPGSRDRRRSPAGLVARLSGRRRHGHGLRVVRRTIAAHGGCFGLRSRGGGTEAVLELPLAGPGERW